MAKKSDAASARGKPVVLPNWWLESLRVRLGGESHEAIAIRISATIGRRPAWDRTTVGNFLRNEHATIEMLDAMCRTYPDLPPPLFFARSFEEAYELRRVVESFSERAHRRVELEIATSSIETDAASAIGSSDGKGGIHEASPRPGDRQPAGVVASRKSARAAGSQDVSKAVRPRQRIRLPS